jgi:hypothetical protein
MLKAQRLALLLPLVATISGCLYEATLDDKGGGTMTVRYAIAKRDFSEAKAKMLSPAVKLVSAELVGEGEHTEGVFKLRFDDVTKLSTARHFGGVTVTRADGKDGTKVLTAKVKNDRSLNLPETLLERFGRDLKVVITFPGEVVESNGKIGAGNSVTWSWGLNQFFDSREVVLTAIYKTTGAAAANPPSPAPGTPPVTAAAGTPSPAAKGQSTQGSNPRHPNKSHRQ